MPGVFRGEKSRYPFVRSIWYVFICWCSRKPSVSVVFEFDRIKKPYFTLDHPCASVTKISSFDHVAMSCRLECVGCRRYGNFSSCSVVLICERMFGGGVAVQRTITSPEG